MRMSTNKPTLTRSFRKESLPHREQHKPADDPSGCPTIAGTTGAMIRNGFMATPSRARGPVASVLANTAWSKGCFRRRPGETWRRGDLIRAAKGPGKQAFSFWAGPSQTLKALMTLPWDSDTWVGLPRRKISKDCLSWLTRSLVQGLTRQM